MLVTVNDDGFYTYYTEPKPCDNGGDGGNGGKDDYGTIIVNKQSIGEGNATFNFSGPNGDFEITTNSDGNGQAIISSVILGTYTITEASKDGWTQTSNVGCVEITVTKDSQSECTFVNTKTTGGGGGGNGNEDGDNGNNNGGGSGGGGSSSGSRRTGGGSSNGEVLGATTGPTCTQFTEYHKTGDVGGEIEALQTFLNAYMNAGLTVNGIYDAKTTQAVHDFQAFHWNEIINPWNPPLSANTTGWEYKTTRMTMNFIMGCPEQAVYLEDPKIMYEVTEVKDKKDFDSSEVAALLEKIQMGTIEAGK
jgi:hypothetical protein